MKTLLPLFLSFTAFAANGSDPDIAGWVREHGGNVKTDPGGRIAGVSLGFAWVSDRDIDRIAQLQDLRSLDLSFSLVTDVGMERLRHLKGVRELNLYSVERITDVSIAYIRDWKDLQRLNLRGTDITDTTLQYASGLPALKSLDVASTQITNNGLEFLPALRTLEEFYAGGNKITGAGLRALRSLPALRVLDLNGAQKRNSGTWVVSLTDLDLTMLAGFKHLVELNIAAAKITDLGLGALSDATGLRRMDLSRTLVSGKGLELIAALPLERLSLWKATKINDDAAEALGRFSKLKRSIWPRRK